MTATGRLKAAAKAARTGVMRPIKLALARRARGRSAARFVAVTGSSGKSTTTALLAHLLADEGPVVAQVFWNTLGPLIRTLRRSRRDTRFVVAELGVGGPGQMPEMATLFRPDMAVVTMIGREHYSAFRSREAVAQEKGTLVETLPPGGIAVLNADDDLALGMTARTAARCVTFGWADSADCRILSARAQLPERLGLRLLWQGRAIDLQTRFTGAHFALPVAAAAAAALTLGVPPDALARRIARFEPLHLRMSMHPVPNGPVLVVDTAKAPLDTVDLAFQAIRDARAPRRRIVLGTVSDYPGARKRAYRMAVSAALQAADEVMVVTESGGESWADEAAHADGRYRIFTSTKAAADHIRATAIPDEIILLKASTNLHLERIMLQFQQDVRCWMTACGKGDSCIACGLSGTDYTLHRSARRKARLAWLLHPARLFGAGAKS